MPNVMENPLVNFFARISFRWADEEKLTFIWNNQLVLGHYDRERKWLVILTPMEPEEKEAAMFWFEREIKRGLLFNEDWDTEEEPDEENWY